MKVASFTIDQQSRDCGKIPMKCVRYTTKEGLQLPKDLSEL